MILYDAKGYPIEVTWGGHQGTCDRCNGVDLGRPATFAQACAQGALLLREEWLRRQPKRQRESRASKEVLRRITRYVGDPPQGD